MKNTATLICAWVLWYQVLDPAPFFPSGRWMWKVFDAFETKVECNKVRISAGAGTRVCLPVGVTP